MQDFIEIQGAREHNLKNIDVRIPRNKAVGNQWRKAVMIGKGIGI